MDTGSPLPEEQSRRKLSYGFLAMGCILLVMAFLVGVGDNPPGIVSILVGFFLLVLGIIYRIGKSGKRKPAQQLLYWAPRALSIVFAVLSSLFALDVFKEGQGFWVTALALLMHLIPTFLILIVLAVSWRSGIPCVGLEQAGRGGCHLADIRTSCLDWSIVPAQWVLQG